MTERTFLLIASALGPEIMANLTEAVKEHLIDEQAEFTKALQVCSEQQMRVLSLPQGSPCRAV